MTATVRDLLAAANAAVTKLQPDQLREMMSRTDLVLVDVRDPPEVQQTGKLRGAINVSRGMIEFRADSATPYHNPVFQTHRTIVLYCASGGRSALAARTLLEMGYSNVYNAGGLTDLANAGLETEPA